MQTDILDNDFSRWMLLLFLGALVTLAVTVCSMALGAVLGAVICSWKLSKTLGLRGAASIYTTVLRGIPELLVIYVLYFGGSSIVTGLGNLFGYTGFIAVPAFVAGVAAVGLVSGAYQAEVYRGAFLAVPRGEIEAAMAIGMRRMQRFRRIILPQVLRLSISGLGNVWQLTLKDSALISVIGVAELMRMSQLAAGSTREYFLYLSAGGIFYLLLTNASDRIFKMLERIADRSMPSSTMGRV